MQGSNDLYVTTLRCNMKRETHKQAVNYIKSRSKERYASVSDYLIAAILNFEEPIQKIEGINSKDIAEVVRTVIKDELGKMQHYKEDEKPLEDVRKVPEINEESIVEEGLPPSVNKFLNGLGID